MASSQMLLKLATRWHIAGLYSKLPAYHNPHVLLEKLVFMA